MDADSFDESIIFTGSKKNVEAVNFNRGRTTVVFGGSEINMTQAGLQGTGIVDIVVIFGALEIIVPNDWRVEVSANAVFGAIEDKRFNTNTDPDKVLRITGFALFAGVEIKSF